MALNTAGLNEAYLRKLAGTANATDLANLAYAQSKGWSYQAPQPQTQPTIPAGYQPISGALYNTRALQQANYSNIQQIGNTLYGIPKVAKSLTSDQLTGGTPSIPTDTLPYQTSPQGVVAGANQYMANLQSDLAAEQARQRELENRLMTSQITANDLLAQIGGKGQEYRSELEKYNYTANVNQLQEINRQIAEANAKFEKMSVDNQGRPVLTAMIGGQESLIRRQQAAEVGSLAAIAQALQGNITLAQNTAKDAINVKYEPLENQLQQQLQQINFIYNDLSRADQKRADAQKLVLEERARELEEQKTNENNILNVALTAAQNGADINTLNAIRTAKTLDEAILRASGATPILTPAGLTGLTEDQIIRIGGKIYKKGKNYLTPKEEIGDLTPQKIGTDINGQDIFYNPAIKTIMTANQLTTAPNTGNQVGTIMGLPSYDTRAANPGVSRADRNNNPGNIKVSDLTKNWEGVIGVESTPAEDGGHFLIFDSAQSGINAVGKLLMTNIYSGMTAEKAIKKYNGNGSYGAADVGLNPNQNFQAQLKDPAKLQEVINNIAKLERFTGKKEISGQDINSNISAITKKPLTQAELQARTFAQRLQESNDIITQLENKFTKINAGNLLSKASIFGVSLMPEALKSEDRKMLEQAQRNFINAVLRKESGAAIFDAEFKNAEKQYFPQIGDSEKVLEQKRKNRQTVIDGMMLAGGLYPTTTNENKMSDDEAYQEYLKIISQK